MDHAIKPAEAEAVKSLSAMFPSLSADVLLKQLRKQKGDVSATAIFLLSAKVEFFPHFVLTLSAIPKPV